MPSFGVQRVEWIEAISKHQEFDIFNTDFTVCGLHFSQEAFTENGKELKKFAIPSIFENSVNNPNVELFESTALNCTTNDQPQYFSEHFEEDFLK